ncbi:RNase adapter RapZ [Peptoniphilus equinus]|uniref:RNase adapter RapZ n=1 Tax=Peptoniphilus equinus TaxID=3016343 RepID=A0ABY7QWY3_9FIRM|nr:RNase adapter RapZ [Peptoniphilus equinus]WBW50428.1 RNase adapter RapZ [Peptoniphilus equinus]
MEIIVITGMSGSGKSAALNVLEDLGYFAMDNLPPALIPKFVELFKKAETMDKVCVVVDVRSGKYFADFTKELKALKSDGVDAKILFLDAQESILVNRYKEKRRPHPLDKSVTAGIRKEKEILNDVKLAADFVLDTSRMSLHGLRTRILELLNLKIDEALKIYVSSFGFKNGILVDSDLIFDVRFLPNPYYISELKYLNGTNAATRDFVLGHSVTGIFLEKTLDLLKFLIPHYIREGKTTLTLGVGCTGGFHRSVVIATELGKKLNQLGYTVEVSHRDIS